MEYNHAVQEDKDRDEENVHISVELTKEELQFVYCNTSDTQTLLQYTTALETEVRALFSIMLLNFDDVMFFIHQNWSLHQLLTFIMVGSTDM